MSRSLRHPFKGSHHYLRAEKDRGAKRSRSKQPRMRQSRFSMESMLDAPDTSSSRPGLRLRITGLVVAGLFALLGLRLWALTVLQAPAAAQAISVNQIRNVPVEPTRGLILDRSGNPLVSNTVVQQITLSRSAAQLHPEVIGRLAALIGKTTQQVQAIVADQRFSPYKPVPVLTGGTTPAAQNQILSDIVYISEHQDDFPGVSAVQTTERAYPQGELPGPAQDNYPASQTLGYVSTINAAELKADAAQGYQAGDAYGQSGLEYQYESALRGTPGSQQIEVTPSGRVAGTLKTTPAVAGDNLVTNLDTNLQQVADNALAAQIVSLRGQYDKQCNNNTGCYPAATSGAVIVMNPQTGAVYAMSSYPSYNLSQWVGGLSTAQNAALFGPDSGEPSLNRAISGQYIPGSTFKLNTATAALNAGLITPAFSYYDNNTFKTPDCQYNSTTCIFHNSAGDSPGTYNVSSALTVSSDDFFYNLGYLFYAKSGQYGATPIQDTAAQYSLGQLTGVDLPGEVQGRVDSKAERVKLHAMAPKAFPNTTWFTGDNIEMAFGQGGTYITPIEQAVAYATFANGGTRYAPQLAAAVVDPTGQVVKKFAPQVTGHVAISPTNYQAMLTGFEGVVNTHGGTAYGIPDLMNFPGGVAGKTGTADTEPGKEPTAWFVGWGPTATAAQYVVVCVIDQAGFGATASAPVVGSIFSYLADHPVGPAVIPPAQKVYQATAGVPLPTPSTTTTTTSTSSGTATSTGTGASTGSG